MGPFIRVVVACLLIAGTAVADEQADFEKGRNAYLARQYQDAEARFSAMVDPKSERALHSATLIDHAHTYLGATLMALGHPKDQALLQFKAVLLHNSDYKPDPLTFPTEVLNAFTDADALYKKEILAEKERRAQAERERIEREEREREKQRRYLAALEKQAGEQVETTKRSRALAYVPFGVGQFQNGQNALGWTFLTAETLLVGATILSGAFYVSNLQQFHDTNNSMAPFCTNPISKAPCYSSIFAGEYYNRTQIWGGISVGAWIGLAAVAIGGVLQANLAFVPQSTVTKPRPLPQITFQIGAGTVGLEGVF
jgi:hypothetical protein